MRPHEKVKGWSERKGERGKRTKEVVPLPEVSPALAWNVDQPDSKGRRSWFIIPFPWSARAT